jgi:hypoxanthine phosphoribosyltransferase
VSDSRPAQPEPDVADSGPRRAETGPAFAHASEAELSRILDFYAVRWEYEPRVFPILWNTDGDVLESFAPDFYLPDLDLYVEMTTLRQKLVRKKNRKLRRLRELYPDVRIKLFYARDFRALMLKYGRLALADELSGTSGQVTPGRPYAELLAGPFGVAVGVDSGSAAAVPADSLAVGLGPTRRRRRRPAPVEGQPTRAEVGTADR